MGRLLYSRDPGTGGADGVLTGETAGLDLTGTVPVVGMPRDFSWRPISSGLWMPVALSATAPVTVTTMEAHVNAATSIRCLMIMMPSLWRYTNLGQDMPAEPLFRAAQHPPSDRYRNQAIEISRMVFGLDEVGCWRSSVNSFTRSLSHNSRPATVISRRPRKR